MRTESELLMYESERIDELIRDEFIAQGHSMTTNWEKTLFHELDNGGGYIDGAMVSGYAIGYGMIVNEGITPERIPFGGVGKGGGGETSEYIKGLIVFWQNRKPGLSPQKYLSLAIKTAIVQKEEGMSTNASKLFSSTGERQNFFKKLLNNLKDIDESIFLGLELIIEERAQDYKKIIY